MKLATFAAVMATTALVPLSVLAQQNQQGQSGQQQRQQGAQNRPAQTGTQMSASDFVNRAAVGNMFEIQSSELAQQRSQSDQVRQFAQRMIQDHNTATERLRSLAGGIQGAAIPTSLDQQHQQMMQTIQNTQGPGFDRTYVQMQVAAHRNSVNLFQQYAQNGDNQQLQQFAQQTLPTLREHLQSAQQLQNSLPPAQVGQQQGQTQMAQGQQMQTQDGANITVRQPAPTIQVDPADPRVIVNQPQPRVSVNQPQPEIIVRQPQPTVTVNIPQPEIVVRMPQPDVNVAMAQPQVRVQQPRPDVRVQQPQQQAQVQVEEVQPQVMFQQQQGQPQVQFQQQGQPQVRYERAEPRVVVNQAEGQPNVRFEQQGEPNVRVQQQAQNQQGQQRQATAGSVYTEEQRRVISERLRAGDVETTGAVDANVQMRPVSIGDLENMNVSNARGDELGEVDRVIVTPEGREFLVVGTGGFLGLGRDRVAFPIDRFWMRGDRLVIRGVTEEDIENMDDYRSTVDNFQRLSRNDETDLRIWQ